jgi:serine/threonine-protein kinase RsbW
LKDAVQTLSVPGTDSGVRQAILAFERFGRCHGVPDGTAWRVKLALDEILSNIVRHGTADARAAIDLTFSVADNSAAVEVVDASAPFNPLLAHPPDTTSALRDRRPGGLGIELVRKLMDDTSYERRGNHNYFVMRCGSHADR